MASAGVRLRSWLPLPLKLMVSYLLVAALIALPVLYQLRDTRTAGDAMLALRIGVGIGVSAALVLSLAAVLAVSVPLRRLCNVARAFAATSWVEVKRPLFGDELRELADALDQRGRQLQAVESLATPAALLCDTFAPLTVNGALRLRAGLTPDLEDRVFANVRAELAALAVDHRGLEPVPIRALIRGAIPDGARFHVTALARPEAPPLWLLVLDGPDRGGVASGRRDV